MIRFPITGGISDIRKKLTAEPMVFPDLRAIIAQKLSAAIKPMNIIVKASLIHYPPLDFVPSMHTNTHIYSINQYLLRQGQLMPKMI